MNDVQEPGKDNGAVQLARDALASYVQSESDIDPYDSESDTSSLFTVTSFVIGELVLVSLSSNILQRWFDQSYHIYWTGAVSFAELFRSCMITYAFDMGMLMAQFPLTTWYILYDPDHLFTGDDAEMLLLQMRRTCDVWHITTPLDLVKLLLAQQEKRNAMDRWTT